MLKAPDVLRRFAPFTCADLGVHVGARWLFTLAEMRRFQPLRTANSPAASPLARHFATHRAHSTDVAIQGTSVRLFYPQGTRASRRGRPSGYNRYATFDFCSPVIIAKPPRARPRPTRLACSRLHVTTGKSEDLRSECQCRARTAGPSRWPRWPRRRLARTKSASMILDQVAATARERAPGKDPRNQAGARSLAVAAIHRVVRG